MHVKNMSAPAWNIYRTRFLIKAQQLTESLAFVDELGREQRGQPGDYLIESPDGRRSIQRQAIFEDIYVPLAFPEDAWPPAPRRRASEVKRRGTLGSAASA